MPLKITLLKRCALAVLLALPGFAFSATLTGGFTPLAPGTNINLTAIGAVDWIHWGQFTEFAYDRKFAATNFISGFTVIDKGYNDGPFQPST